MSHNLIPVRCSPVPFLNFQMAPRFRLLIPSGDKKGTQIRMSEWNQNFTLTANVGWVFILRKYQERSRTGSAASAGTPSSYTLPDGHRINCDSGELKYWGSGLGNCCCTAEDVRWRWFRDVCSLGAKLRDGDDREPQRWGPNSVVMMALRAGATVWILYWAK